MEGMRHLFDQLKNYYFWLPIALLIITQIKIYISVLYMRKEKDDEFIVQTWFISKIFSFKWEVPIIEISKGYLLPDLIYETEIEATNVGKLLNENKQRISLDKINWDKVKTQINFVKNTKKIFIPAINEFLSKIECTRFYWSTEFGSPDPAITGFSIGVLWSIKSVILSIVKQKIALWRQPPILKIKHNFYRPCFNHHIHCIFTFKLGHIIIVIVKIVWQWLKKGVNSSE